MADDTDDPSCMQGSKRDRHKEQTFEKKKKKNSLLNSVGGAGGMIWENSIETYA